MKIDHTVIISVADTIMLDINLFGLRGINALNILPVDPETEHVSIVSLSVNAVCAGLTAGFFSYLTKPIKTNEFMTALNEAMKFSVAGLINKFVGDLIDTTVIGQLP
jgi:CheY-like chemotaxis protein